MASSNITRKKRREKYSSKWKNYDAYKAHPTGIKKCNYCKQILNVLNFARGFINKDGLQENCRKCSSIIRNVLHEKHRQFWKDKNIYEHHKTKIKKCPRCKTIKDIKNFSICRTRPDGLQDTCKTCTMKAWKKRKHGIEVPKSDSCDICNSTDVLSIDHCHKTNKLRGTLCRRCNMGIGFLKENEKIFLNAIKYLNHWNKKLKITSRSTPAE